MTQPSSERERRIVVGVDGSAPSKAALAWAVRQARLTGAVVDAVIAWEIPSTYGYPMPVGDVDFKGIAAQVVADAITEVSSPGEPVKIRPKVVEGYPARVLLDASEGAELLVIGNRGHGGFVEALLGSVGQHCVHHATCEPTFAERQQRTLEGARIIADRLLAADSREAGVNVVSGGTDVHLVLVDLRNSALDGKQAEDRLHQIGITVNRNAVPFDPRPPMVSSGIQIGTPALATRGFGGAEFTQVAEVIAQAQRPDATDEDLSGLRDQVAGLAARFPLYPELAEGAR